MNKSTFDEIRQLVYDHSGITLGPTKMALVDARIGKRLRVLNLPTPEAYVEFLKQRGNQEEFTHFIDVISTNVTSFFRESDHFDFMTDTVKNWAAQGQRKFRFWSAACSTGQEPYSMAITLLEALKGFTVDTKILATDISTEVLELCKQGIYREDKIDGVNTLQRQKFFNRAADPAGQSTEKFFQINDEVKRLVAFSRINLSSTPYPMKGPMDMIFVRNVMIYFDNELRARILSEAQRLLRPGGFLLVGHSEGLTGQITDLKLHSASIYTKPDERSASAMTG